MPISSRRRFETFLLALVSFWSVVPLRWPVEDRRLFASEMAALVICGLLAMRRQGRVHSWATAALPLIPVLFAVAARRFATPVAFEMTALTCFGAMSLAMAIGARSDRTRGLSLVTGGFLVLFGASISDSSHAMVPPLIWMLGCVWHLVANHWERLDLAMPDSVTRTWTLRPAVLIVFGLVACAAAFAARDRFSDARKLNLGIMPTSGGSRWSDPAARKGVGSGDAAIAAKDHAESFGAVDSDIFLESTQSSLFDMFNDLLGEPKKKNKSERRQAVANQNVIPSHGQTARSEQGGSSFSIDRLPPTKHQHFDDAVDHSVVQWDGPTGIRLAMHRYDTFDGTSWTQSAHLQQPTLSAVRIGENVWFFDPSQPSLANAEPDSVNVGLLKVIRLDSTRLPTPMLTAGLHIKDIDRQDFFGIDQDGCFYMPGRERVPPLTVVHVASRALVEDELHDGLVSVPVAKPSAGVALSSLVGQVVAGHQQPYEQLRAIVKHLRSEFTLDRSHGTESGFPVREFVNVRRGGDHLFATAAALMAREIGLRSRLVTGFYVRPDSFDVTAGHASVIPSDAHVWAEVQLDDERWFEIEPTPGYREPVYRPSIWLRTRRFVSTYWLRLTGLVLAIWAGYVTRRIWLEWLLSLAWGASAWLRPRERMRLAMKIIETRARLAGQRRPSGRLQRDWIEDLTRGDSAIAPIARRFCDAADAMFFGLQDRQPEDSAGRLVRLLKIQTISRLAKEAAA
jgi:hypothetical protein